MATTGLELKIGADVEDAVDGLKKISNKLATLGKTLTVGALGFGALIAKAAFLDPLLSEISENLSDFKEGIIDSLDPMRKYTTVISDISAGLVKNAASVIQLVNALESGKLSVEQTRLAQSKLVKEAPAFKDAFDKNGNSVKNLSDILQNSYIPALINTIKVNAASEIITKKLKKNFDAIAASGEPSKLQGLVNGFKNFGLTFNTAGFSANQTATKFKNLKEAQDNLTDGNIQAIIQQTYKDLGITFEDFGKALDNTGKPIKETTRKLKEYDTASKGILAGILANNSALEEQARIFKDLIEQAATLRKERSQDPTINLPDRQPRTAQDRFKKAEESVIVISPEALKRQGEYALLLDEISEKYKRQLELTKQISGAINNGINAGIDTFFNALANNQDPFEALAQSAKRLVAELASAVVKALVLQAITNAIAPGSGAAAGGASGLFKGVVRGNELQLLTFLRG